MTKLIEQTIFGKVNYIDKAVTRLKEAAKMAEGLGIPVLYVADSGGKDSDVIIKLAEIAEVPYEVSHNHTTADHPITVKFIRKRKAELEAKGIKYIINKPRYKGEPTSMWKLIEEKGYPTRLIRYCCQVLKEGGGDGRFVVTGVRWAESSRRKTTRGIYETFTTKKKERIILTNDNEDTRRIIESCYKRNKFVCNPIIDWTDEMVWEFHKIYNLSYNQLYDQGYKRVGCIGCPMSNRRVKDFEEMPKYKEAYRRAGKRYYEKKREQFTEKYGWETFEDYWDWWVSGKKNVNKRRDYFGFEFEL